MSGASDYLLRVVAPDLKAYEELLRTKLTRIPGVHGVESAFALKRVVYRTNLPLARRSGESSRPPFPLRSPTPWPWPGAASWPRAPGRPG